ncbi:Flagellar hook-associated protein 2, partial [human gut metagenome]
ASSNWLADYASIKNGSYAKLMKAYYGKENTASKTAASDITKKDTTKETAKKALAKVETATDALKESADTLLATGKNDLFAQKDITTKDENGIETTTKGYDTSAIYNAVNSFVKNYNSVMAAVDDVSDTTVNNRTESLGNTTIANSKQLAKIGITMKNDGTLSLDKDTFMKADMNTVEEPVPGERFLWLSCIRTEFHDQFCSRPCFHQKQSVHRNSRIYRHLQCRQSVQFLHVNVK